MKHAYLEVTYRMGRPVAAYYYLPRHDADASVRTERNEGGLLVDYASDGRAIGIEISSPSQLDLALLNQVLARLGHGAVRHEDIAPVLAA